SVPPTATSVPPTATSVPPTATPTAAPDTLVIRINSGSFADATFSGVLWKLDQYATGGGTNNATAITDIAGTADDTLYRQTRRANTDLGTFSYAIPVPANATYRVRLHFAEIYWGATGGGAGGAGKRVFSANLEGGATELANYDINAEVGPMTAVVKEYTLAVSDGTLNIDFSATVNRPLVSAIEVFRVAAGGAPLKAGLSAPLRQTTPVTYTTFLHTDFDYDGVGRLVWEEDSSSWATYGYDQVGNRTQINRNGTSSSRSYNAANQVVGWSYDAAGNLMLGDGKTYYYDALNRLTRVNTQDKVEFHYNGDGVLTSRNWLDDDYDGYDYTTFVNDLAAPLSQALVVQAPLQTTEAWYGLDRLASHTGTSTANTWYLADGVGTARATLNDAGNLNSTPQYDAWGVAAVDPNDQYYPSENPYADPFGFTGEYTDPTSDLVYLRARWYNPAEGTLLGRDPFEGVTTAPYSMHPYQYGYSDPVSNTDPSGNCVEPVSFIFCIEVIIAIGVSVFVTDAAIQYAIEDVPLSEIDWMQSATAGFNAAELCFTALELAYLSPRAIGRINKIIGGVDDLFDDIPPPGARKPYTKPALTNIIKTAAGLADHIKSYGGRSSSGGISGAHNKVEWDNHAAQYYVRKTTPHPTRPGITHVEYSLTELDFAQKPTGKINNPVFPKTIYDPAIYSDAEIYQWGLEAAAEAYSRNAFDYTWKGTASNGMEFKGYRNDQNAITSFFPFVQD
ncbi:MAG: EndoU domain-containing protein, partial [Herpetosiphonaceae bacterium]|nr:EndoU domain-containing protein [Herpetosiphonaceae bacterium]